MRGLGSEMINDVAGTDLDCGGEESFEEEVDEMVFEGCGGIGVMRLMVSERA